MCLFNIFKYSKPIKIPKVKPLWTSNIPVNIFVENSQFSSTEIEHMKILTDELKKLKSWHDNHTSRNKDPVPGESALKLAILFFEEKTSGE